MGIPGMNPIQSSIFPINGLLTPEQQQALIAGSQAAIQAGTSTSQIMGNTPIGLALGPTFGSRGIDFQWSQNVIGSAALIANGQIAIAPSVKTGLESTFSTGGSGQNGIANRYLLQRLAKLPPDSPDALKLEQVLLKVNGNSPDAKAAILANRFQRIQAFGAEMQGILADFPPGSQDRAFIETRITALSALANNAQIEAFILQNLGDDNNPDVRSKLLRETLQDIATTPEDGKPETAAKLQNLAARVIALTKGAPIGQQLVTLAARWRTNNLAIANFQKLQQEKNNSLGPDAAAAGNNPLAALFSALTGGAGAKPPAASPSSSIFTGGGGDALLGSGKASRSIF